uniref:Putative atp synthase subunit s mitochondrial n=1 Tax=Haematobia irritans TaxID=7368 RepID=A0A1L8EDI2_HAEIR
MILARQIKLLRKAALPMYMQDTKYVESSRLLWGYVAIAFNRVDLERQRLVGADRLCAEWVIKNGGAICTIDAPKRLIRDYNTLPPEHYRFKIKVVDGSGASLMKIGLEHFKGCNHIDTVVFHQCKHLEADGLDGLLHLKQTLNTLQISECDNISDDGLTIIEHLENLKMLRIFNMRYVKDLDGVIAKLKKALPNCNMEKEAASNG